MKTADLKPGDHVAYKSSKWSNARHAVVVQVRPRQQYHYNGSATVGLVYDTVPEEDRAERIFWARPQTIVSSWADELLRKAQVEKAVAEREARETLLIDTNSPRLETVRQLAETITGYELSTSQERRLLLDRGIQVWIDIDKLEALAKALTEVSS